jgi:RNA polymerase sigma-70 factor (ECF subfamily)
VPEIRLAIDIRSWLAPDTRGIAFLEHKSRDARPKLLCSVKRTEGRVFDESYLAGLRDRNPDVENHLITCFSSPVRAKLRARLRSPELVEDAFQETFLRILSYFRSGKTLQNPGSLPGFVHGMCQNVAMELLRGYIRHEQIPEHHQGRRDDTADPQLQLVNEERKAMVRRLLDEMPERDRRVLKRIFLDEEDKDIICRELNVDRNHLRLLLFRARQRFRAAMGRKEAPSALARS